MMYTEKQLEGFSKPPFKYETKQVIETHKEIRTAIDTHYDKQKIKDSYDLFELPELDPFLQGSYNNSTNISKSSDVDFVIRLKNVWRADTTSLTEVEKEKYVNSCKDSIYSFVQFNDDIIHCLQKHFGFQYILNDDKCIRLRKHSRFCDADIVPAFTYKLYGTFESSSNQVYKEGIVFDTNSGKQIINFPKLHQEGLVEKSKSTNGNFKESVRMFKTIRDELIDNGIIDMNCAKSYYVENLLFNVSSNAFSGTYKERFGNILEEIITDFEEGKLNKGYMCANKIYPLISDKTWNIDLVKTFLIGLIKVLNNNSF